MLVKDTITYSDFLVNFERHPINKDLVRVVNESAVSRSIRAIVLTNKGEVPYQPGKGSNIKSFLFEQMTTQTSHDIKEDIIQCITNQEPRAQLIGVQVNPDYDNNIYTVIIAYTLLNDVTTRTVNITLERIN